MKEENNNERNERERLWKLEARLAEAQELDRAASNATRDWGDDGQVAAQRYREQAKALRRPGPHSYDYIGGDHWY